MTALPVASFEAVAPSMTEEDVRSAVALHVAATILPARATVAVRETVRSNWFTALIAIMDAHEDWALAYVPGVHHGDNETYAVHLSTGGVFGGHGHPTAQKHRESTAQWLVRLSLLAADA